ncbi:hypothetical protein HanPI659440_Chr11g0421921 [Helianthus annuus]|nr:hypothetical protein HanPI659440_Chr11g0421921 [Helianthus annuus]
MSPVSYSVTLLVLKIAYSCFVIVFLCIWTLKSRLLFVGTANHIYVLVFVLLECFDVKEEKVCVDYSFVCVINCFLVLCNDILMCLNFEI